MLHEYEERGREDLRLLLNAQDGAIVTDLTASSLMFKIVKPIVQYGKGKKYRDLRFRSIHRLLTHADILEKNMAREVRVAPHQIRRLEGVLAEDVIELVDKDTVLLNVIAASNMTGVITDLKTIVSEARKINPDIYVVTDAVQHAPHAAIDVKALQLDGINIAPYKFLATEVFPSDMFPIV